MAKLGFFLYSKIDILLAQLEKAGHKIKQAEWKAYFEWYLEDSKKEITSLPKPTKNCLI